MSETKSIGTATAINNGGIYQTDLRSGSHRFIADEPEEYGGEELGPAPADYLCAALASCKAITIRMYVNRKGWNVDAINVTARFVKGDQAPGGINTFFCEVQVTGELAEEQRKRILEIAKVCPVDRLLQKPSNVVTELA
jgi:putative redox protein